MDIPIKTAEWMPDGYFMLIQKTANYLYKIEGEVTPEQYQAISMLRQLINEEFVSKNKQVSNQLIYDILKEVL